MPSAEHETPIALAKVNPGTDKYHSEVFREIAARNFAEGEAQGEAKGEAHAVLTVLEARGIPASAEIRERILACTDLAKLESWLRRAVTAASADEVVLD